MTVKELKQALQGIDENLPVEVCVEDLVSPKYHDMDYMWKVNSAKFHPSSSISNAAFTISTGESFSY